MNRTKIEWVKSPTKNGFKPGLTSNPFTGCENNCFYCYARKIYNRFYGNFNEVIFHPNILEKIEKCEKQETVFIGSMTDMFQPKISFEMEDKRKELFKIIEVKKNILALILTKFPVLVFDRVHVIENLWLGTTVTKNAELSNYSALYNNYEGKKFISFEPLLEEITRKTFEEHFVIRPFQPDWVIIGLINNHPFNVPRETQLKWALKLFDLCRENHVPVFLKDNVFNSIRGLVEIPSMRQLPYLNYFRGV